MSRSWAGLASVSPYKLSANDKDARLGHVTAHLKSSWFDPSKRHWRLELATRSKPVTGLAVAGLLAVFGLAACSGSSATAPTPGVASVMPPVRSPSLTGAGGTVWAVQFINPNASPDEVKKVLVAQGIADGTVSEDASHYFTIQTLRVDLFPAPTPGPGSSASSAPGGPSSASGSPTPAASPAPNSVDQNGNACYKHLPARGLAAQIAKAFEADPNLGPISCTRDPLVDVGPGSGSS